MERLSLRGREAVIDEQDLSQAVDSVITQTRLGKIFSGLKDGMQTMEGRLGARIDRVETGSKANEDAEAV